MDVSSKLSKEQKRETTVGLQKSYAELLKFIKENRYIKPEDKGLLVDRLNAIANDFKEALGIVV